MIVKYVLAAEQQSWVGRQADALLGNAGGIGDVRMRLEQPSHWRLVKTAVHISAEFECFDSQQLLSGCHTLRGCHI